MPAALAGRELRVILGGTTDLHDVDLSVPRGWVTGLLGPSGCGKSALMRAIVGVQRVGGGTVEVLGEPAGTPALRRVGDVTQAPSVYAHLSVHAMRRPFLPLLRAWSRRPRSPVPQRS